MVRMLETVTALPSMGFHGCRKYRRVGWKFGLHFVHIPPFSFSFSFSSFSSRNVLFIYPVCNLNELGIFFHYL